MLPAFHDLEVLEALPEGLPVGAYELDVLLFVDEALTFETQLSFDVVDGPAQPDSDEDLIPDHRDNCPFEENLHQRDRDGDGRGDACECGDANGDGRVDTSDARRIQRCAIGHFPCPRLCDASGDGRCDTTDARLVQRFAAGQIPKSALACREQRGGVTQPPCLRTGCSGQVCAREHVVTTCEYLPEYGCLRRADCGPFGSDGECVLRPTPASLACFESLQLP